MESSEEHFFEDSSNESSKLSSSYQDSVNETNGQDAGLLDENAALALQKRLQPDNKSFILSKGPDGGKVLYFIGNRKNPPIDHELPQSIIETLNNAKLEIHCSLQNQETVSSEGIQAINRNNGNSCCSSEAVDCHDEDENDTTEMIFIPTSQVISLCDDTVISLCDDTNYSRPSRAANPSQLTLEVLEKRETKPDWKINERSVDVRAGNEEYYSSVSHEKHVASEIGTSSPTTTNTQKYGSITEENGQENILLALSANPSYECSDLKKCLEYSLLSPLIEESSNHSDLSYRTNYPNKNIKNQIFAPVEQPVNEDSNKSVYFPPQLPSIENDVNGAKWIDIDCNDNKSNCTDSNHCCDNDSSTSMEPSIHYFSLDSFDVLDSDDTEIDATGVNQSKNSDVEAVTRTFQGILTKPVSSEVINTDKGKEPDKNNLALNDCINIDNIRKENDNLASNVAAQEFITVKPPLRTYVRKKKNLEPLKNIELFSLDDFSEDEKKPYQTPKVFYPDKVPDPIMDSEDSMTAHCSGNISNESKESTDDNEYTVISPLWTYARKKREQPTSKDIHLFSSDDSSQDNDEAYQTTKVFCLHDEKEPILNDDYDEDGYINLLANFNNKMMANAVLPVTDEKTITLGPESSEDFELLPDPAMDFEESLSSFSGTYLTESLFKPTNSENLEDDACKASSDHREIKTVDSNSSSILMVNSSPEKMKLFCMKFLDNNSTDKDNCSADELRTPTSTPGSYVNCPNCHFKTSLVNNLNMHLKYYHIKRRRDISDDSESNDSTTSPSTSNDMNMPSDGRA